MFADREKELKRLEQALLDDEEETEENEEYEEDEEYEEEDEYEDEEEYGEAESEVAETQPEEVPYRDPRGLIAVVLLVTAGVLLFLAFLLAKQGGLI